MTKPENTPQAAEANEHEADNARQVVDNTAFQEGNTATETANAESRDEADDARQVVDNTAFQEGNTATETAGDAEPQWHGSDGPTGDTDPDGHPGAVDHTEAINRLLTDDLRKRFDAVGIAGLERAITIALTEGRTEEQITEELNSDIDQIEKQHAERKAHAEQMEAEAKAETRRIERLTTASIILGPIIGGAAANASRKALVSDALGYADELIAQVDKA